jgi:serine/threonine-protein kinase
MAQANADRNMLFGVLALQMDFITRDQLVAAMQAWVNEKGKPLGQILREQRVLPDDIYTLLEALVQKHLALHGNDPEKSLAAVSSAASLRQDLKQVADADVQASLGHVGKTRKQEGADPYATMAGALPPSVASGQRFRVLRPHARGGLGEVLVAADQELPREVALKQIQDRHADNPDSRARFIVEAAITGGLEHPGIVPVYGLGTYADGRPYYAMRFIRGDSLQEAVERFHKADAAGTMDLGQRTLEMRGLLGRFIDVCNAVAYAHSRGVLHRDLKPGNIMIGKYGETLVVDWGLAKLLGGPESQNVAPGEGSLSLSGSSLSSSGIASKLSHVSETVMGSAVGTPRYMSPEQAAGRLDQLGPASDVYSLGATLYCILTGQAPIMILDLGEMLQKSQRGEFPTPRQVKANIARPLEAICLKAMALKPEDRYTTPRALADDLEHWLADEPVSAWPEPWTVKTRRWLGRHRTLVTGMATAAAVAILALASATALLTAANERERKAKEYAQEKERDALEQKKKADANFRLARGAVDRYHTAVSEDVLLNEPGMEPLRKKLLESAREFYQKFTQEHAQDSTVKGELGLALFRLGQISADIDSERKAIPMLEQAANIFQELSAEQQNVEFQSALAACYHHLGRLCRLTDQIAESEKYYIKAAAMWEQLGKEHPQEVRFQAELARTQLGLGNVYQLTRRLDLAQKEYQLSLDARDKLAHANPAKAEYQRDLAISHNNLAMLLEAKGGKENEAEHGFRAALDIQKQLTADIPKISQYQNDLARTYFNLGDLYAQTETISRAEKPYQEAAKIWQTLVTQHAAVTSFHTNQAEALLALAEVYRRSHDTTKAEESCLQALEIERKLAATQKDIPQFQGDLARGYSSLGDVYRSAQKIDKAESAYRDGLAIEEKLAHDLPEVAHYQSELARSYHHLALLYTESKQDDQAVGAYEKALAIWERLVKQHPGDHEFALGLYNTCFNLGKVAKSAGHFPNALTWFTRAQLALESNGRQFLDSSSVKTMLCNALWMRAEVLTQLGRYPEALTDWDETIELAQDAQKPVYQLPRAFTLARAGKYHEATTAASALVPKVGSSPTALYRLACVYSVALTGLAGDAHCSVEERMELGDQYAAQAVKLLAAAKSSGYFNTAANRDKLHTDPDLQAVRLRPEFKKLTEDEMK